MGLVSRERRQLRRHEPPVGFPFRRWLAPVAFFWCDAALTLAGQPAAYWAGVRSAVDEFNPVARHLLGHSPAAFLAATAAWCAAFVLVLCRWRHPAAGLIASGLAAGHAVGAAAWLTRYGPAGWAAAAGLLFAAGRTVTWTSRPV